jgi:hypothetical protein
MIFYGRVMPIFVEQIQKVTQLMGTIKGKRK